MLRLIKYFCLRLVHVINTRMSVCWVLFVSLSPVAKTQAQLHFNHLSTANGLSQNINAFIHKDRQGFVWISSLDGLNRFDGQTVRVYRPEKGNPRSLVGNNMQSPFFEDEQGNLWFGTDGALNCYHPRTDDFSSYRAEIDSVPFTGSYYLMHRSKDGRLWARLNDGLYILTPPTAPNSKLRIKSLGPFEGLRHFKVLNAAGEPEQLWSIKLGKAGKVFCYLVQEDSLLVSLPNHIPPEIPPPNRIAAGSGKTAWFCTANGLWHVDYGSGRVLGHYTEFQGRSVGGCFDFKAFDQRTSFVSTETGLMAFDQVQKSFIRHYAHKPEHPSSLVSNNMLAELYVDRDAILWVSIWTQGVDYADITKSKFGLVDESKVLLPNETAFTTDELWLDDNGDLWLGSNMDPLRVVRRGASKATLAIGTDGKPLWGIHDILRLHSGDLLMMSNSQIMLYDVRERRISGLPIPWGQDVIQNAVGFADGSALLCTDSSLYRLHFTENRIPVYQKVSTIGKPKGSSLNHKILKDSKDRVYVSSQDDFTDLFQWKAGTLIWIRRLYLPDEIHALAETDSAIWISTMAKLVRIPAKSLVPGAADSVETILNRSVYGLLPDNNGNLWLSTNNGLMRYDTRAKTFRQYHLSDGLQGYEYNSSSYQRTPDGRFWFGGVDGVNVFYPDSVRDIQTRAPVLLTGMMVNDEPLQLPYNIALADTFSYTYQQNTLSFDFVVADYSDPQHTQHWYRMTRLDGDSPDKDWIKGQDARGFARYANLDPGEYLFEIKGANADGVVNPELRTVFITIHPPFWQTWWFITLCLLVGAVATYAGVKYYIREKLRLKNLQLREQRLQIEKQDALTKERNRIAGEMHDDLGGGLTSIRMLSERLTAKTDNPDMKIAVDKIANHAQNLVLRMSEIIWAMNSNFDTVDNLIAYIRRYSAEYLDEHNLRSVIHVPEKVPNHSISGEKRRNVYLAIKESLHNIVKHARAERVNIDFELENNALVVRVHDNGKGIDSDLINQFGNGLSNMKKRLEDVGGTMTLANYEGTLITFTMPLNTQTT